MKKLFLIFLLVGSLFGIDRAYFLPSDGKEFSDDLIEQLENAKESIKIAIYNFEHKKIARILKKKARDGVRVIVLYSKKDVELHNSIDSEQITRRKLHTKMAIIDDKVVVFGSSNWSKKSFKKNYEMNYITDREDIVLPSVKFFSTIR